MTTATKRIVSGSLASWTRIGITVLAQLLFVPLYLRHWDGDQYGVWLLVQAAVGMLSIADIAFQNYLQGEFYKIGPDPSACAAMSRLFCSAVMAGWIVAFCVLLVLALCFGFWGQSVLSVLGVDDLIYAGLPGVILAYWLFWLLQGVFGGIAVRVVAPYGYFARTAWWGVVFMLVTTLFPVIAVLSGGGVVTALWVWILSTVVINIGLLYDLISIMRRIGLYRCKPDLRFGMQIYLRSQLLTFKNLAENFRQQGLRVVLAPLAGASDLAAFSTMRTASNVALQGVSSIVNPMLPDIMRFLGAKDQERCNAALSAIWLVVVAVLSPAVLVLLFAGQYIYASWTAGRFEFDPSLFSLISAGVLVYALAQPAMAIAQGYNLIWSQLVVSAISMLVLFPLLFALVPKFGLKGAGVSLLLAEIVAAVGYSWVARRWVAGLGLAWPAKAEYAATFAVAVTFLGLFAMVVFCHTSSLCLLVSLGLSTCATLYYWRTLPAGVADRLLGIFARLRNVFAH